MKHIPKIIGAIVGTVLFSIASLFSPLVVYFLMSGSFYFFLLNTVEVAIGLILGLILGQIYEKNKTFFIWMTMGSIFGFLIGFFSSSVVLIGSNLPSIVKIIIFGGHYLLFFPLLSAAQYLIILGDWGKLALLSIGVPLFVIDGAIYGAIIAWLVTYFKFRKI